jgi:glycerol uptake facilitator-like aquaporin
MRSYVSEFIGTALLLAIVAGSGIMGETLGAGNAAVALLGNSIATGAGLYALIVLLGPISGAHFNPVVTLMFWKLGHLDLKKMVGYWACQFTGAISGIWLTHIMFSLPLIQESTKARTGLGIWVSELVATLVLLSVIYIGDKQAKDKVPMLVALTVTAGYWFTSSTFFSNPAVAVARSFTNTFVGIAPSSVFGFVVAEVIAALLFVGFLALVMSRAGKAYSSDTK